MSLKLYDGLRLRGLIKLTTCSEVTTPAKFGHLQDTRAVPKALTSRSWTGFINSRAGLPQAELTCASTGHNYILEPVYGRGRKNKRPGFMHLCICSDTRLQQIILHGGGRIPYIPPPVMYPTISSNFIVKKQRSTLLQRNLRNGGLSD